MRNMNIIHDKHNDQQKHEHFLNHITFWYIYQSMKLSDWNHSQYEILLVLHIFSLCLPVCNIPVAYTASLIYI